mgnify:CR=1 FL=1
MALIKLNNQSISAVTALPSSIDVGKVLQVVNVQKDSSFNTTSSSPTDYGLTCSITPSSSSNYIILNVALGGVRIEGSTYMRAWVYKQINGGGYSAHDQIEAGFGYSGSTLIKTMNLVKMLKISPNTTSQVDFKIYVASANGSNPVRITVDGVESSTLTAYEIKG